jgi:cytidine deaminase
MKKVTSEITYAVCDSVEELPQNLAALCRQAERARETAYAPYSHFKVGAAVLLANGITVIGSNQENAAYPSGLCAERVAVFAASAQYPGVAIEAIAIAVTERPGGQVSPVSPCGDCRQVMAEYEHRQKKGIKLLMPGGNGSIMVFHDIGTLLPFMFSPEQLGKE